MVFLSVSPPKWHAWTWKPMTSNDHWISLSRSSKSTAARGRLGMTQEDMLDMLGNIFVLSYCEEFCTVEPAESIHCWWRSCLISGKLIHFGPEDATSILICIQVTVLNCRMPVWVYKDMKIWSDMIRYDMIRHDKIRQEMTRYDTIWYDMLRYVTLRYEKIWQDMTRYDKIWQDM